MALKKKEVLLRPTSPLTIEEAIAWTRNWVNSLQEADENKDEYGHYIDYFFADLFDGKTGDLYRIFSDACKTRYDMTETVFSILKTSDYAKVEEVQGLREDFETFSGDVLPRINELETDLNSLKSEVLFVVRSGETTAISENKEFMAVAEISGEPEVRVVPEKMELEVSQITYDVEVI
jgi:hypothetical protein